jgi:UDP-3-O-[3-hydroxymyristoyl] glucosamine N-acyltransferase
MADPRFHAKAGPFTLGELAAKAGASLAPGAVAELLIGDVAPLAEAGPGQLSFLDNPKYLADFQATRAAACIVAPRHVAKAPVGVQLLVSPAPYKAYAIVAQAFYPSPLPPSGVHPRAVVEDGAVLGEGVSVGPGAVIAAGARIGAGTAIGPNAVIGNNVVIGDNCTIGALASVSHAEIGNGVTLHPGVRIGQDGFGFAPDPAGHVKVPQLGRVIVGAGCDIGANSTIDRGAGPDTVIGPGCWIDNLVQIGHNVVLGRGCIIVAQSGVAGSSRLGDFVALGAQGGIAGHLVIGAGAQIAAQSGVMTDVPAGETFCGAPAIPIRQFFREVATVRKLAKGRE